MIVTEGKPTVRGVGFLTVALALFMPGPVLAEDDLKEIVRNMTIISNVSYSAKERTEKRYRYVLPQFVEICEDVDKPVRAGDMLVTVLTMITKTGMEQKLLPLVETLYSMTQEISGHAQAANIPLQCSQVWAMYVNLRQKGQSPAVASRGVAAVSKMLYRLGSKK